MDVSGQWTVRFLNYEPIDEALDERMRRIVEDADKIPDAAMSLDKESGVLTIDCERIPAWRDGGRSRLRCIRIGRSFVVKPPWESAELAPHERLLEIDPAGAFGSALHETTRLCLLAIERHLKPGLRVLELGTGSGVLAIAAARCGVARVLAVDIDEAAVNSARANVLRNDVAGVVQVCRCDGPPWPDEQVDVVIANITYDTLLRLLDEIAGALKADGTLIAAGISSRHWHKFVTTCKDRGFDIDDEIHLGPWSALIATRRTP